MEIRRIQENCRIALKRLETMHIKPFADADGPVVYISDTYPGVWLEHVYDGLVWAQLTGDYAPARNYIKLFIDHQSDEGQLPCYVWANRIGYTQIQECVSFGRIAFETAEMLKDAEFDRMVYAALVKWDGWLCAHRDGVSGLIDMYSGYDTGHDHSGRLDGMKYEGEAPENGAYPQDCAVAPLKAPDMNAVFYGDRCALAAFAEKLGLMEEAAHWKKLAQFTKERLMEVCFDETDEFFYDVDKNGRMRRCRNISITNVFCEHVPDQALADRIFDRYFRGGKDFDTPYPWPSVSSGDALFERRKEGNSWGYYCQALTMLRTFRWMKQYGYENEFRRNLRKWLEAWTDAELPFGQELDPFTGKPSKSSPWYSSCLLLYVSAAKELGLYQ